ncbi:MAG: hypothetical protein K2Q09_04760, partial [Phycisphaerales bacterium]|nr:hypothetical protein [Phycisphaerales bacterium]
TTATSAAAPWPNSFFYSDQLTAFEVWLEFATEHHKPPEQLPIVLQVLLSQAHRHRALYLLARFLDLGPWATNLALSVGIFPYVLKLLQSPAQDLRLILVFIWAKILALDHSCQTDLVKDQEPPYFLAVFNSKSSSDLRTMAAFVLSVIMDNHPRGQAVCLKSGLLSDCLAHLSDPDPLLRRWVILCLGKLWEDNEEARWAAVRESAHERLCGLLTDSVPEVRAAVVFALGTFIQTDHTKLRPNAQTSDSESDDGSLSSSPAASATGRRHRQNSGNSGMELRINIEMNLGVTLPVVMEDASPMVRKELICALSRLVDSYSERFKEVASEEEHRRTSSQSSVLGVGGDESPNLAALSSSPSAGTYRPQQSSVYACLWKVVLSLRADPVPDVAVLADRVVRRIYKSIGGIASLSRLNSTSPALSIGSKGFDGVSPLHLDPEADHAANTHQDSPPVERPSRLTSLLSVGSRSSVRDSKTRRKIPTPSEHHQPDVANLDDLLKDDEEGPIALSSQFYEWSCEYFSQPLHVFPSGRLVPSTTAIEDPVLSESSSFLVTEPPTADLSRPNAFEELHVSSGEYAHLVLRQRRNNRVITEAFNIGQNTKNAPPKIDYPIAILDNATSVSRRLAFHPFEPLLISVNDQNNVGVWNWEEGQSFNSFANQNAPGTRITSLCLMNQQYDALLATGSNEGTIRIWKDFANQESPVKLLTAFRALPDFFPTTRGSGLIFDWNHERGVLAVSGDLHVIRLWDMDRELCTSDIQTLCDSPVTCLSSDRLSSHSLLAGFGNGKFRTFDTRAPTRHSTGIIFPDFETWVVNAQTLSSDHQVVAASASGMIKIFDLRQT